MRYERVIDIVRLAIRLQATAEGMTLDDIAEHFSVSRRTAERMRDAVEQVFGPLQVAETPGKRHHWKLDSYSVRAVARVTAEELAELEAAANALERAGLTERAAALRTLSEKLRAVRKTVPGSEFESDLQTLMQAEGLAMRPGPRPRLEPGLLSLLRDAIRTRREVEFDYFSQSQGRRSRHRVQPYGVLYGNRPYLVGQMPWADDTRIWRLSNISNACWLNTTFEPDPSFDLQKYAERSFGAYQEPPFDVVWQFDAEVAEDAATFLFHPNQSLFENDDGSLTVKFRAGGLEEMCWHLFTWGQSVTVQEPERLNQRLAELCASLALHHGNNDRRCDQEI